MEQRVKKESNLYKHKNDDIRTRHHIYLGQL